MNFQELKQDLLNCIKKSLLLCLPLALALLSISANKALASEEDNGMSQINSVRQLESKESLHSLDDNEMSQITNVNQLRDVSPTDWAYEALRSLVDRYSDARSLAPDGDAGVASLHFGFS